MANEKKYSAQEAALAVLAKAQELMGKSELFKAEKLKKDFGQNFANAAASGSITPAAIQQGARSVGGSTPPPPPVQKAENPDEKQDAKLGEDVEGLCERHMTENKDAERKEGHKLVKSEMCKMCKGEMKKAEYQDLYEELAKVESLNKNEQTENKEEPSNPPKDPSKPIERDHDDFEAKPGHAAAPDHRQAEQKPPQANPKEQHEGNNPPAGTIPGNGIHKLMYFTGHMHAKKKMKKGIAIS